MRLATYLDKARLEAIITDPVLRTWTAFEGADPGCDANRYLTVPSFAVIGDEGCFLAHCIGKGRYVVHTNLLPTCRGTEALRAAREALRIAFLTTDCLELVSMVPGNMPHVLAFAKLMGMRTAFTRSGIWPAAGMLWGMTFLELTIDDWIRTGVCKEKGQWFHRYLGDNSHAEDSIHDAYVGATVEMIEANRARKAVKVYNRWAKLALYEPIEVLSEDPLRIDIKSHVLRVEGGNFNVEACHA